MKTKPSLILASLAMVLSCGLIGGVHSNKDKVEETHAYYSPSTHYEVSDTASELASYYSSISDSDSGTSLLSKLQSLNSTKRKRTVGYSTMGTDTNGAFIYTDYDLNSTAKDSNGQTYGTKVASFYTRTSATSWNREHMWPNSHGGNNVEADILHTRPTITSENSSRGNSFYVEGKKSSTDGWDPYTAGYAAEVRGECARVILYCVVAYPSFTLSDANSHSTSNSNKDNMMGNMNTLIKWHFDYPPNIYEKNRNDGAEYLQGNRNPFVDHPEYVARIWSSFNSTVSTLCTNNASKYSDWEPGNYCNYGETTPVNNAGVTISKSSASISVGGTTTLSAAASNSGTISWTTSNSSIVSLSSSSTASGANVTITGVAAGTATITAKATIDGTQYSKTCTVTVTKVVSSLSKGSTSPTKTTYTAGESFDSTGLTITATYSDSTTSNVTSSVVWTPDPLTAGTTSVTGTFGGKTIVISGLTVNAATEPEIIDNNSDLSAGDYVVLRTAAGVGVTGWNNNKDATVSETESEWKKYYVASASSSGFTLKDESASNYIANPGSSNQFTYGSAATCITDSDGHLICNNRYLCKNGTNYRFYSSISSYLPFFIYKVPASSTKTLSSISVATAPTKVTYTAGEYFDPTGLFITRTYSDSTSDTYAYAGHTSEFTFSPSTTTALTTSNTSVTITYSGKSTSQAITVNAAKTLSSISVSTAPTKTSYYSGQTFDPTGLVIRRTYSDSTYDTYTYANHTSEFSFSPSTSTALTTSNVSVTITYGGKSTSQAITVSAVTLTSIAVSTAPTKLTYVVDECFNPTGLVITRNYSNSTSDTYTYANHTSEFSFNPSLSTGLTTENTTVTITYGGKSTTQAIAVTSSGGGGSFESGSQRISASTTSSYYETGDICPTGNTSSASATCDAFDVSWLKNSGTNSIVYTYAEMRIYASHSFTISPKEGYTINSIVITAGNSSYASAVGGSSLTNCTKSVNNTTVTLTPTDGESAVGFTNTAQSRLNYIVVEYEYESSGGGTEDPTSITATVSKTFYVGETITSSDISVKDNFNNDVEIFTFADDGYQFTYADAASGGALTNKTFTDAVLGSNLTCSLTVQVQRKERVTPTGSDDLSVSYTDLPTSYQTSTTERTAASGVKFIAYNLANYSSKMQFKASGGYFQTTESMSLKTLTINNRETNALTVYGSTDGTSFSTSITGTNDVYDLTGYNYVKVMKNGSGAAYCASLTITVEGGDTAINIANYVMYEDTINQCNTKLDIAIGYLNNLTQTELNSFANKTESEDYVIYTARTRLNAWAASKGKTINYSTAGHVAANSYVNPIINAFEVGNATTIIIIICIVGLTAFGGYIFIKKRKEN